MENAIECLEGVNLGVDLSTRNSRIAQAENIQNSGHICSAGFVVQQNNSNNESELNGNFNKEIEKSVVGINATNRTSDDQKAKAEQIREKWVKQVRGNHNHLIYKLN